LLCLIRTASFPCLSELPLNKAEVVTGIVWYQFPSMLGSTSDSTCASNLGDETRSAPLIDAGYEERASAILDDVEHPDMS